MISGVSLGWVSVSLSPPLTLKLKKNLNPVKMDFSVKVEHMFE